jgi:hypothetical protein
MAFPTKEGKPKSSRFRANRADREHAKGSADEKNRTAPQMREPGARAQANEEEGKSEGNPEQEPQQQSPEEGAEEQQLPGIHDEIKQVMAEHGPAHTIHMVHDHEGMRSHIHSIHADGHEHHADQEGEQHVMHAHHHAGMAAGVPMPGGEGQGEGQAGQTPSGFGGGGEEESYSEPL